MEKIGGISLRIGYTGFGPDSSSLYFGGQIGYNVNEKYRGDEVQFGIYYIRS
jgi:hypothetical protein